MVLQVVILAGGRGRNLYPLTTHIPKMLIPISNKPLIIYLLEMLSRSEIKFQHPVHILTQKEFKNRLDKFLETRFQILDSIKYETHSVPEDFPGTVGAIKYALSVIPKGENDLLVISGDLILDYSALPRLIEHHRINECGCTILAAKGKSSYEDMQFFALKKNQVVKIFESFDNEDGFVFPLRLFQKFPRLKLRNDLIQNYCYIFKTELLNTLFSDPLVDRVIKLKEELIPYLVQKQQLVGPKVEVCILEEEFSKRICDIKSFMEISGFLCVPLIADKKDKGAMPRVLPPALLETASNPMNVVKSLYRAGAGPVPANFKQVSSDCIISEEVKIGNKCSISKSIIGKNTKIGNNVKIVGSVVMDNVVIEDDANLNNAIICHNAVVENKCKVLNSQMAVGSSLQPGVMLRDEVRLNLA